VVPLERLVKELQAGQLPLGQTVALTFDDGYKDNYTQAFPIMQQHGLTATFFLATGYIGSHKSKWDDALSLLLASTPSLEIELEIDNQKIILSLLHNHDKQKALSILIKRLRVLNNIERERILTSLVSKYASSEFRNLSNIMLSWEDVQTMVKAEMTFGAHTINHVSLASLDNECVTQEIIGSKQAVEMGTKRPVTCFSYPYGKSQDFSVATQAILQAHDFTCGVTSISGINTLGQDPFALKRIAINNEDDLLDWELKILEE
jgi:peptidoglycan/xylan/chitin deacetylase (PgdA/CDA1 family)